MKLIAKTVLVAAAMVGVSLIAEAQDMNESFRDFRKQVMDDYHGFRKKVLDDYAKYLDGVWKEFEAFKGVSSATPHTSEPPSVCVCPIISRNAHRWSCGDF